MLVLRRLLPLFLIVAASLPLRAQVTLRPANEIQLFGQHSYIIGLSYMSDQWSNGDRLFLYTTQDAYSAPLVRGGPQLVDWNPLLGWQREFDLTPFNLNLFEPSIAAVGSDYNRYYFTGGLSLNRVIAFQQSPITTLMNAPIGTFAAAELPAGVVLRRPVAPGVRPAEDVRS